MEDRVRELEISVAVIKTEMKSLTDAVAANTAAAERLAVVLSGIKGAKATIAVIALIIVSLADFAMRFWKGV